MDDLTLIEVDGLNLVEHEVYGDDIIAEYVDFYGRDFHVHLSNIGLRCFSSRGDCLFCHRVVTEWLLASTSTEGRVIAARAWDAKLIHRNGQEFVAPQSISYPGVWPPGVMTAECYYGFHSHDLVPAEECECGLYGLTSQPSQMPYGKMLGLIECYGRIIVGEHGVRAERASILGIVMTNSWDLPLPPEWEVPVISVEAALSAAKHGISAREVFGL